MSFNPKEYKKMWYQMNKERIKTKFKEYYLNHKGEISNYYKKYYINHKNELSTYRKDYYYKHKEKEKVKMKKYRLKKQYELTISDFNNLLLAQNMRCAICNQPLDLQNPNKVHIDHDHKTGKVRGVLCRDCNLAIGYLKDNPEYTKRATEYLERN